MAPTAQASRPPAPTTAAGTGGGDHAGVLPHPPGRMALLVGLVAGAVFVPTLWYGFVWDNTVLIVENHYIKYAWHIPSFFRLDYSILSHGVIAQGFYRPLLALSFFLDYQLWGLHPAGYHLTNLLAHAGASALVCLLALRLAAMPTAGVLAGLLFALHPVHIEPVAFTSGRVDVIAAVFLLAAVLLFLRGTRGAAAASAACFGAALLMKEMAITLPAILLLLAAASRAPVPDLRQRLRAALVRMTPHAVVLAAYGLLRLQAGLPQLLAGKETGAADPLARALTALATVGRYVQLDLFLLEPAPYYEGRLTTTPWDPWVLLGLAALAGGAWLIAWGWRRDRMVCVGLAWFFVTLLPVANLLPIPGVRDAALAERYVYIPSIGICLVLGAGAGRLAAWAARRGLASERLAAGALALVGIALYAPVTLGWMPVWKNNEALYHQMVRRAPEAAFPHISLAGELLARGETQAGHALIARALTLGPARPEVHRVHGAARRAVGDLDGAIAAMRRALALAPESVPTLIELGTTLGQRGALAEALPLFERVLASDPQAVEAYNRMGVAYFTAGQLPAALHAFRRAADRSPDFVFAYYNAAVTLHRLGRDAEALVALQHGLRLAPTDRRLTALLAELQPGTPRPDSPGRPRGAS